MSLKRLFWLSLALALALFAALAAMDLALKNAEAPAGIVSFELCAYTASCAAILQSWDPQAQLMAALSLGVDYLFMLAYPAAICIGLLRVARCVPSGVWYRLTLLAAGSTWVMAGADAVENYCLAQMLLAPAAQAFAWPAAIAASVKFALLAATLGWLLLMYGRYVLFGQRPVGGDAPLVS